MLTETQAWNIIGHQLLTPEHELLYGLCWEISRLHDNREIDWDTFCNMKNRLRDHIHDTPIAERYVHDTRYIFKPQEHRAERAIACYWMALEAEEDEASARALATEPEPST